MVHCALCWILMSNNVIGHKDGLNFKIPHSLVIGLEHIYRIYLKATDHYVEHANLLRTFFKKRFNFAEMFYLSKFIVTYIFSLLKRFLRKSHYLVIFLIIFFCFFCLQPLLSAALLDHLIHHDRNIPPEYTSPENYNEIQVSRSWLYSLISFVLIKWIPLL